VSRDLHFEVTVLINGCRGHSYGKIRLKYDLDAFGQPMWRCVFIFLLGTLKATRFELVVIKSSDIIPDSDYSSWFDYSNQS